MSLDAELNKIIYITVPLVIGVILHEVSHGYIAYKMGDDTAKRAGRLTLNPVKHLDFFGSIILPLLLKISGSAFLFGYAKPVPINPANFRNYRKGMLYVSAAGALTNLVLAFISSVLFHLLKNSRGLWKTLFFEPFITDLFMMLGYSIVINSGLCVFNLIPIPPLDGSKILGLYLPDRFKERYNMLEKYGIIIMMIFLSTDFLNQVVSFFVAPLVNFLLGK